MSFDGLSKEDIQRLLQFSIEVYKSRNYLDTALQLLESLFGFSMTAYYSMDDVYGQKEYILYPKGNGLTPDFLYHTQMMNLDNSAMFDIADRASRSNSWNGAFYSQEVPEELFTHKEYMDFIKSQNIRCYAKLIIDRSPSVYIVICKDFEEDYFDQREKKIISVIADILSAVARREHEMFDQAAALLTAEYYLGAEKKGLLIFSEERRYYHFNEYYEKLVREKHPRVTPVAYIRLLRTALAKKIGKPVSNLYMETTCVLDDLKVTITPCGYPGINGKPERYFAILLMPDQKTTAEPDRFKLQKYHLTERESEIIRMIMQGDTYNKIAQTLGISLPTVKTHTSSIYTKLGVKNKVEAINKLRH